MENGIRSNGNQIWIHLVAQISSENPFDSNETLKDASALGMDSKNKSMCSSEENYGRIGIKWKMKYTIYHQSFFSMVFISISEE